MMTSKLKGVEACYSTLEVLNAPTTIRGRVTTQLEMALPGTFEAKGSPTGKESFKTMQAARLRSGAGFQEHPALPDAGDPEKPYLIVTSEIAPEVYLAYLKERDISWIAAERGKIHLSRPLEQMVIVGGPPPTRRFWKQGF